MRKRKRTNTILRVYKFRCYPRTLPEAMWATAKGMRALWNSLVVHRERLSLRARWSEGLDAWKEWDGIVKYLLMRSGLNWECGPAVVERFTSSCVAAAKGLRGWPSVQRKLRIMIPHRFTGGGITSSRLFSERASRISLKAPSAGAYADNRQAKRRERIVDMRFGLSDGVIESRVRLHRPVPEHAIVKQVGWCGERFGQEWIWQLTVTVEEIPVVREVTGKACGVDIGWRLMDDSEIRVAVISDNEGNVYDIRLPLQPDNAHSRRHTENVELNGWVDLVLWDTRLAEARKRADWQEYRRIASIRRHLYRRLIGRRDWIYRNISAWLADRYDEIAIEGDLGVKEMAESENYGGRCRQIAAPASFLQILKSTSRLRGSSIIAVDAAYTTRACSVCGDEITGSTSSLYLTCPRGHKWDQDVNAAQNLLSQTGRVPEPINGFRKVSAQPPAQMVAYIRLNETVAEAVHAE